MRIFLNKLIDKLPLLTIDFLCVPLSWILAFWLRANFMSKPYQVFSEAYPFLLVPLASFISFYYLFKVYRGVWRFISLDDFIDLIKAVTFSCLTSIFILFLSHRLEGIPRSIFPIYSLLLVSFLAGTRVIVRLAMERKSEGEVSSSAKKVIVVGAGSAGEHLTRDILRQTGKPYNLVGLFDDDKRKMGRQIHGIKILGKVSEIPTHALKHDIDMIFVAMPSVSSARLREIYQICESTDCQIRILPSLNDLASGFVGINALRNISIEDLLGRSEVKLDWQAIEGLIKGKRVLVTGGGGSIGSELCRQVARLTPQSLAIIDYSECNLYHIDYELRENYPNFTVLPRLIDVSDKTSVDRFFSEYKPDIVFHAAAFKHVPLLQEQAIAAIKNNVLGTEIVSNAAVKYQAEKFILISTDKAVNPTNTMGKTKRVAELVCQNVNSQSQTQFITVRFGNVLGSAGSVIPLFKKQLEQGGPLTVTDPNITRFFMTIPEACTLILQAGVLGSGGEVFVLDMGKPVKITYLAEELIRLSGKEPYKDIDIKFIGLRPGEKLYEELFYANEPLDKTPHEKIMKAHVSQEALLNIDDRLNALYADLNSYNKKILLSHLNDLVPNLVAQKKSVTEAA